MKDIEDKCDDYARYGVAHVFIISPDRRTVLVPRGGGFPALENDLTFDTGGCTISIRLTELFEDF
jgi:hypothetical protein